MRISSILRILTVLIQAVVSVQAVDITGDDLKKALEKNPNVLIEAIKANKKAIFEIINQTGVEEQARLRKEAEEAEKKAYEDSFRNPLKPAIDDKTRIRGRNDAKYTLVEYADFECPYCAAGNQTVEVLRNKHSSNLRFIFKHVPLPSHPQAMPAALWTEAVAIQSPEKAWKFHDILFKNQDKLGFDFFKRTAKNLNVDVKRCEKDVESQAVIDRITADTDEAKKFGFDGIPSFLLNGIPVKGAHPLAYFEDIIKKLDATDPN